MSDDREQAWAELEARAQRLLEHAREVEPRDPVRRYGSLLRLWHWTAFDRQTTWTILTPGRKAPPGAGPLVREVTWDRAADQRRLFDACAADSSSAGNRPQIGLREAALPLPELQRLLAIGNQLMVPLVGVTQTVGLDGDYFGVETYEVSPNVRLQWWGTGPTEWRHFTDWVAEVRTILQHCLDQTG